MAMKNTINYQQSQKLKTNEKCFNYSERDTMLKIVIQKHSNESPKMKKLLKRPNKLNEHETE